MSLEDWKVDPDREDMSIMQHMKSDVFQPLMSAPVVLQERTVKAVEYVGSRSKIEVERVKQLTKTILDAEERERTYGSGGEWRKWIRENVLYVNGTPLHREILVNMPSGITVALVNLPLSISLGIAADATPAAGCITAVWSGLCAGALGGSHFNIVGPTGALSGILSKASVRYGEEVLPLLAIMTGFVCLGAFVLKLDQCAQFVPLCVMQGFSVGVAIIICANQLNFALGLPKLPRHELLIDNVMEQLNHIGLCEWQAIVMFFCFFFGQLVFSTILPKVKGVAIPWAVIMASIGMICGYLSATGVIAYRIQTLSTRYPGFGGANLVAPPVFHQELFTPQCQTVVNSTDGSEERTAGSDGLDPSMCRSAGAVFVTCIDFFQASLSIAFVAVLETLISAKIAAKMTKTKFNQRKEVLSIGLANIFSGAMGGIPATAALARTALNIKSGAKSR